MDGNGGNGMIIHSYCGSFPHSLLSTRKMKKHLDPYPGGLKNFDNFACFSRWIGSESFATLRAKVVCLYLWSRNRTISRSTQGAPKEQGWDFPARRVPPEGNHCNHISYIDIYIYHIYIYRISIYIVYRYISYIIYNISYIYISYIIYNISYINIIYNILCNYILCIHNISYICLYIYV